MGKEQPIVALIDKITIVPTEAELPGALDVIGPEALQGPTRAAFINAHAINLCYKLPHFCEDLSAAEHLYRDGSGMKIHYLLQRKEPGLNLNGTDFIPQIMERYRGKKVAVLATESPFLERACEKIAKDYDLEIPVIMDGFQSDGDYAEPLKEHQPALIILGMGMPKQERVAALLSTTLDFPCLIVCGGAIIDFIGGKVQRCPMFYRKYGIEWVYRLIQEPKRLFKRYLIGNAVFLTHSLQMAALYWSKRL